LPSELIEREAAPQSEVAGVVSATLS